MWYGKYDNDNDPIPMTEERVRAIAKSEIQNVFEEQMLNSILQKNGLNDLSEIWDNTEK